MQYKISKIEQFRFKPIKVELTLEDPNDLFYICAILNVNVDRIKESSPYLRDTAYEKPMNNYQLWLQLDQIAEDWMAHCRATNVEPNPGYSNLIDEK